MLRIPEGKGWHWKKMSKVLWCPLLQADVHSSAGPSSTSVQDSSMVENRSLVSPPLQNEWESQALITAHGVPITAEGSSFPFLRNVFSGSFEFIETWICSLPASVTGSPQFLASFHLVHKSSFSFHFHYKSETSPFCSKVWRFLHKPGNNFQRVQSCLSSTSSGRRVPQGAMLERAVQRSACRRENGALCSPSEPAAKHHRQFCGSGCGPRAAGCSSPRAGHAAGPLTRPLGRRAPVTEEGTMRLFVSCCSWYIIGSFLQPEYHLEFWH